MGSVGVHRVGVVLLVRVSREETKTPPLEGSNLLWSGLIYARFGVQLLQPSPDSTLAGFHTHSDAIQRTTHNVRHTTSITESFLKH